MINSRNAECVGLYIQKIPGLETEYVLQFKVNTKKPQFYELHAHVDLECDTECWEEETREGFVSERYCEKVEQLRTPTHIPVQNLIATIEYGKSWQAFVDKYGANQIQEWIHPKSDTTYKKLDLVVYSDWQKDFLEATATVFHVNEGLLTFHKGDVCERDEGYVNLNMDLFKQI